MSTKHVWYDWPLILAYHSISERRQDALAVRVSDFEGQMARLYRHGYRSMTLAEFTSQPIKKGERIVIITFDDGYADNYTLAFPTLKRYGFVATIFLVSDYVNSDRVFAWDVPKITTQRDSTLYGLLTYKQVHEMAAYGIEFGSHTCTHPELTKLSVKQYSEEIVRSRQDLQARLGCQVVSFCYPRGKLNTDVIRMVEQAGYRCAVVTATWAGIPLCRYTLRRVGIYHNVTPLLFRLKIMPLVRRNHESLRRFTWKR
jgi:peptidoglycan/xylan/chitin deacetylase (PgdA/CDA1 family)